MEAEIETARKADGREPSGRKLLSVVVSAFNEEAGIRKFYEEASRQGRLLDRAGWDYELVFVNDGSKDRTGEILRSLSAEDPEHVRCFFLSRNFGHEAAMTCGLDHAGGDGLVFMDADLQHPPECLGPIAEKLSEGYEVISMARKSNKSAGIVRNVTSGAFYWVLNRLSSVRFEPNASDFFAISRRVGKVLRRNYRERVRYLRGYVQEVGFRSTVLSYEAAARFAGHSHYSIRKLFAFSINIILCFSNLPLKLGIVMGLFSGLLGFLLLLYTLLTREGAPSGYATIVILNCFMFAMLFFVIGIIGQYIAVMFEEGKDRPIYIVDEALNYREAGEQ